MIYEVKDEYSLWEYRLLRRKWLEILKGDDRHSVYYQLVRLLDDNTKWRMVNEVRRLQDKNAPFLHRMLDEWFWERQALGIRRITEEDDSKSRRSVFSVVRIIDEMIAHRALITRANYMNSIERADEDRVVSDCEGNFDRLSQNQERTPADCASEKFLKGLRKKVRCKLFDDIIAYANKFVAHSSDPRTRREYSLTLEKLDQAYQSLAEVVGVLAGIALGNSQLQLTLVRGAPVTDGWELPFAQSEIIQKLHKLEKDRHRLIELWGT